MKDLLKLSSTKRTKQSHRQKSDFKTMIMIFNFVKYLSTGMHNFFVVTGSIAELVLTNGR